MRARLGESYFPKVNFNCKIILEISMGTRLTLDLEYNQGHALCIKAAGL
jgi:hypothetical protein